jgi:hypothetical protein
MQPLLQVDPSEVARGVRCEALYPDEFNPARRNRCEGDGVLRFNSATGKPFMGCSLFPRCMWSRDLTGFE